MGRAFFRFNPILIANQSVLICQFVTLNTIGTSWNPTINQSDILLFNSLQRVVDNSDALTKLMHHNNTKDTFEHFSGNLNKKTRKAFQS